MSGILCSMVAVVKSAATAATRIAKTISAIGNAQVDTAQSKFGGSSALFDGTGDYLQVANHSDFNFGSNDFTIELFVRATNFTGSPSPMGMATLGGVDGWNLQFGTDGKCYLEFSTNGTTVSTTAVTAAVSTATWTHIAFVRNGNSITPYKDGVAGTAYTFNGSFISSTANLVIGDGFGISTTWSSATDFNGHLDEIRISKSARYTANFTPSTTPFLNDANTLLLIHADGTDATTFFEDDNGVRASRSLIANGNAQIDTAQSKFGGSALLCDGTGDYVSAAAGSHFDFGTGDFTIEFFIRFNAINTLYVPMSLRPGSGIGLGEWWCEVQAADNKMYWGFKNQAGTTYYANFPVIGTAMTTGSFHHVAVVKSGSTLTQYFNGVANGNQGTGLTGSFGNSGSELRVGAGAGAYSLNGWIDEVRISTIARYSTTFTPTTSAFVNDTNTLLLMHANGTDASTTFTDDNA